MDKITQRNTCETNLAEVLASGTKTRGESLLLTNRVLPSSVQTNKVSIKRHEQATVHVRGMEYKREADEGVPFVACTASQGINRVAS
jgi:hypothetical protein